MIFRIAVSVFMSACLAFSQVSNDPFGGNSYEAAESGSKLDGLWTRDVQDKTGIKHYSFGRYNVSYANRNSKVIISHAMGFFAEKEGASLELPKFVTSDWSKLRNKKLRFQIEFQGADIFVQTNEQRGKEIWLRQTTAPGTGSLGEVTDFSSERTELDGSWYYQEKSNKETYRTFQVFDRGRWSITHFNLDTQEVDRHMIGLYSYNHGIIRFKILYATTSWQEKIGAVEIAKVRSHNENQFEQTNDGGSVTWTRVGKKPEGKPSNPRASGSPKTVN